MGRFFEIEDGEWKMEDEFSIFNFQFSIRAKRVKPF